jgi:hypothetical protein
MMRILVCASTRWLSIIGLLILALFIPIEVHAVVGDVNLTGLPPNTTITLTDAKTGQTAEGQTDDKGAVVIPLGGKNWSAGQYTLTARNTSIKETVNLTDGANKLDFSRLPYSGVRMPGTGHVLELELGSYFPDGSQKDVGTSFMFRFNYTPPIRLCCDNSRLNIMPYVSFVGVPDMSTPHVKRLDFFGQYQGEVRNASQYGVRAGGKAVAPLGNIGGWTAVGVGMFGIGTEYSSASVHRFNDVSPEFQFRDVHNFDKASWGFLFDIQAGLSIRNSRGCFLGIRGGLVPTHDDWLNGRAKFRSHGELGLVGGFTF